MKTTGRILLSLIVQFYFLSLGSAAQVVGLTSNTSVEYGDTVILTCTATSSISSSVTFNWFQDAVLITESTRLTISADSLSIEDTQFQLSHLEICNVTVSDVGRYTCEVSNGSFSSSADTELSIANLTLQVVAISNATSVEHGSSTVLVCSGFGGLADVTISWQRNGQTLTSDSNNIISFEDFTIEGAEGTFRVSYLQLCNVQQSGNYTCLVSNGISTESSTVAVTVPDPIVQVVAISNATTVLNGTSTLLVCSGLGERANVTISWLNNGQALTNDSNTIISFEDFTIEGAEGTFQVSYLQLCNVQQSGNYTCLVSNGISTESSTVAVTVQDVTLQVVAISNATTILNGTSTLLACSGFGEPVDVTVSWQNNGQTLSNDSNTIISFEDFTIEGAEGTFQVAYLQLCNVQQSGNYTCLVSNGISTESSTVAVTVQDVTLQVVAISNATTVLNGTSTLLVCSGFGEPVDVTVSWQNNGQTLSNDSNTIISFEDFTIEGAEGTFQVAYLQLCNVQQSGNYTCLVSNGISTESSTVAVTVQDVTLQVVAISNATTVLNGTSTLLVCSGFGEPVDVTVSWQNNGQTLSNDSNTIISFEDFTIEGAEGTFQVAYLQLCNVQQSGSYTCLVSNGISTESSTVVVTVQDVTLQLVAISNATTVPYGRSTLLVCSGFGEPADATISWQRNGQALNNDSYNIISFEDFTIEETEGTFRVSYLQLCNVQQSGNYTCLVSNGISTESSTVLVTISETILQVVAISNATTVEFGGSALLMCTGYNGTDMVTIFWQNNGQTITNNSNYIIMSEEFSVEGQDGTFQLSYLRIFDARDYGRYTCLVTNGFETESSNVSVAISGACERETQQVRIDNQDYGSIEWPSVRIGDSINVTCPCEFLDVTETASRSCGGNISTGGMWLKSDFSSCQFSDFKRQSCNSQNISDLMRIFEESPERIGVEDIDIFDDMINTNLRTAIGNTTASDSLLDIINSIMHAPVEVLREAHSRNRLTSRLLENLDALVDGYPITEDSVSVARSMFGCVVNNVTIARSFNFTPGLRSNDEIQLLDSINPFATFTLPTDAIDQANPRPNSVAFCAFVNDKLFTRRNSYLTKSNRSHLEVGSHVISAHFEGNITVSNLQNDVKMTFFKREGVMGSVECSFWDQDLDEGFGAWSTEGCFLVSDTSNATTCRCNHLTNFAIVVDPTNMVDTTNMGDPAMMVDPTSLTQDQHIGGVMILGPIILLICAIFTFICVVITKELRSSPTGIFLGNLCVAVALLCIVFIIAYFVGGHSNFCAFMAFMIHYSVLVVCLALPTMAFFIGFTPFAGKRLIYLRISGIVNNWVLPLVIVIICIAFATEDYRPGNADLACRPDSYPYWIGLLLIAGLLLIITAILLFAIFVSFKTDAIPTPATDAYKWYLDFFGLLLVAVCFYIAWGFGLPAMKPLNVGAGRIVFQIIFIIFCILCGVLMVLFFCVLSPPVREVLCCGYYGRSKNNTDSRKKSSASVANNIYMETKPTKSEDDDTCIKNEAVDSSFSGDLDDKPEPQAPGVTVSFDNFLSSQTD